MQEDEEEKEEEAACLLDSQNRLIIHINYVYTIPIYTSVKIIQLNEW